MFGLYERKPLHEEFYVSGYQWGRTWFLSVFEAIDYPMDRNPALKGPVRPLKRTPHFKAAIARENLFLLPPFETYDVKQKCIEKRFPNF
jgi:hypothetical protein